MHGNLPLPVYPELQAQVKEPPVLVQVADSWQSWEFAVHSSISKIKKKKKTTTTTITAITCSTHNVILYRTIFLANCIILRVSLVLRNVEQGMTWHQSLVSRRAQYYFWFRLHCHFCLPYHSAATLPPLITSKIPAASLASDKNLLTRYAMWCFFVSHLS